MKDTNPERLVFDGIAVRAPTKLERQLFVELGKPAADWSRARYGDDPDNLPATPPPELLDLVKQALAKITHIGFVQTPLGWMVRDEPDILEQEHDAELVAAVQKVYAEVLVKAGVAKRDRKPWFRRLLD